MQPDQGTRGAEVSYGIGRAAAGVSDGGGIGEAVVPAPAHAKVEQAESVGEVRDCIGEVGPDLEAEQPLAPENCLRKSSFCGWLGGG